MKMNKLVALLAALCILCGALPVMSLTASAADITLTDSYEAHKYVAGDTITGVNNNRGSNTLIKFESGFDLLTSDAKWLYNYEWCKKLYDAYGAGYTCTNAYGYEVAVNQFGIVTEVSSAGNMKIPEGGYVLSGFDNYHQNLKKNVKVGDYIRLSGGTYYVYKTTADSKFTDASAAFKIGKSQALEIVEGGKTPTKATQWTTTVLCKATGTGNDGVANHLGYVVKLGGKEIEIPTGYFGIVLSGSPLTDSGESSYNAAMLFKEFAAPGAIVNMGNDDIYFRYDAAAAKRAALLMAGKTGTDVSTTYDYSAATILNDAKTKFELVNTARLQELYNNISAIADKVQSMTTIDEMEPYMATLYQNYEEMRVLELEKRDVEMRALWWRPLENTREQLSAEELDAHIEANVKNFKQLGYNQLFVEAFYNSCAIFPIPSTAGYNGLCFSQNPYLVPTNMKCGSSGLYGLNSKLTEPYDMLKRTIEICEEYDIECHVWWQVLYIGYERHNVSNSDDFHTYGIGYTIENDIKKNGSSSKYYNWLNVAHDGTYRSGSVDKKLTRFWLNPGNDGVRQLLLNLLDYVCANYDPYSFQLDYFRHPNDGIHEFGYDSDTVAAFKKKYTAYKNTDLTLTANWKNADWVQFRADYITSLIGEMRNLLDTKYPEACLTTSPQPDPASALKSDLQDVSAWLGNGYIDNIYPMAYGYHIPGYVTPTLVEQNSERFVSTGLSVGYENEELELDWIRQIRQAGADGVAHFGVIEHYADTIWSEPAVTPTGNAARAARVYLTKTMAARAAKMLELSAIDQTNYDKLLAAINNADLAIRINGVESTQALTAINAIQTLANSLGTNPKNALTNDVNYILKIRDNSHDAGRQAREESKNAFTLTVDGAAKYVSSTDTIYVTENDTKLSGELAQAVTVYTENNVSRIELDNVTLNAGSAVGFETQATELWVVLTGVNTYTADKLTNGTVKYIGTGALYNGDELVMCKGDVTGSGALDSDDLRNMMQYSVKSAEFTDEQVHVGDANGDSKINTIDIRIFLDKLVNQQ